MEQNLQKMFWLTYNTISEEVDQRRILRSHEFEIYSQEGEDGLLLYIFSKVGATNRCFVEFGVDEGKQCNTANLSIYHGWHGLLMEANGNCVATGKEYYKNRPEVKPSQVNFVQCFVTTENINKVLFDNGIEGEIDLLSIDIDGNDYWVWKAINVISPRVVAIEYNASLGTDKSLTIKYEPDFDRRKKHPSYWYHGALLAALTKLANSKGYILVGCNSDGVNAFFIRKDVANGKLQEVSVQEAYYPHSGRLKIESTQEQFERIKHLDFVHV